MESSTENSIQKIQKIKDFLINLINNIDETDYIECSQFIINDDTDFVKGINILIEKNSIHKEQENCNEN